MRARPSRIWSNASFVTSPGSPEAIITAGCPPADSRRHWSAISAISGLTTIVRSPEASPGSW